MNRRLTVRLLTRLNTNVAIIHLLDINRIVNHRSRIFGDSGTGQYGDVRGEGAGMLRVGEGGGTGWEGGWGG